MKVNENNNARQFLLGRMTDEDQSVIESEFFESRQAFDELLIAENALIDDYVSGRLPAADREAFERRMLVTDRQRRRAAFAETLISYASRSQIRKSGDAATPSVWQSLFGFFRGPSMLSNAAAAAAIVVVAGAALWWSWNDVTRGEYAELTPLNTAAPAQPVTPVEIAPGESPLDIPEGPSPDAPPAMADHPETTGKHKAGPAPRKSSVPAGIATLVLPFVSTRDAEAAAVLVVPPTAKYVSLQLTRGDESFSKYFVVIETVDGQQIWRGKAGARSKNKTKGQVAVMVPSRLLKPGDYIAILKGSNLGLDFQTVGESSFVIGRR